MSLHLQFTQANALLHPFHPQLWTTLHLLVPPFSCLQVGLCVCVCTCVVCVCVLCICVCKSVYVSVCTLSIYYLGHVHCCVVTRVPNWKLYWWKFLVLVKIPFVLMKITCTHEISFCSHENYLLKFLLCSWKLLVLMKIPFLLITITCTSGNMHCI